MNNIDYEKLEKSLQELQEQYGSYATLDEQNLSEINQRAVKNSVIKCFEICYDTLWKSIKKNLAQEGLTAELPNSPKPIFRLAHQNQMIDQKTLSRLFDYAQIRGYTAHDYSIKKAIAALDKIGLFIEDAEKIYAKLTERQ